MMAPRSLNLLSMVLNFAPVGSAAGSMLAYALGASPLPPAEHERPIWLAPGNAPPPGVELPSAGTGRCGGCAQGDSPAAEGPSGRGPPLTGALSVGPEASEVGGAGETWADPEKCPKSGAEGWRAGMFGHGWAALPSGPGAGGGTCGWCGCCGNRGGSGGGVTTRSKGR